MTHRGALYLMTSSLVAASMVAGPLARAQDAGPEGYGGTPGGDPPARVGRLAVMQGTVSMHGPDDDHWSPAVVNAPVFTGNAVWTEPQALAEVQVSASSLWMDGGTEFDLTTLDDGALHAATPQGEVYVHLRSLQPGETFTLETPRGTVTLASDGRYDIFAGDTEHPTAVTVLDGAAQVSGNNISLQVHANQTASIDGQSSFQGSVGPLSRDAFLDAMLQREQPPVSRGAPPPAVVAQMTGCDDLGRYGSWEDNGDDGAIWYPQVDADWVPYRDGRWLYVAPWGWTWVDNAPWGFAPFHYGRWVQVGPRWGWAPAYRGYGLRDRPVYAPALVGFFGLGVGIGIGVGLHAAFGPGDRVGWVPLGPREAYYPPYRVSRGYVDRVNVTSVRDVRGLDPARQDRGADRFANSRFATVVRGRAMATSEPVRGAFTRVDLKELAGAHVVAGRPPIAPGARTMGLTPRVAQQWNVRVPEQRRAPGPAAGPALHAEGHGGLPALRPAHGGAAGPALRPGAAPVASLRGPGAGPERGGAGAPGPRIERPEGAGAGPNGRPALRTPGEGPLGPRGAAPMHGEGQVRGGAERQPDLGPRPPARQAMPTREPAAERVSGPAHPDRVQPARVPLSRPGLNEARPPVAQQRPIEPARPRVARPQPARPAFESRPQVARPEMARPEMARPQMGRPQMARPQMARPPVARPEAPRTPAPRPQPHPGGQDHHPH